MIICTVRCTCCVLTAGTHFQSYFAPGGFVCIIIRRKPKMCIRYLCFLYVYVCTDGYRFPRIISTSSTCRNECYSHWNMRTLKVFFKYIQCKHFRDFQLDVESIWRVSIHFTLYLKFIELINSENYFRGYIYFLMSFVKWRTGRRVNSSGEIINFIPRIFHWVEIALRSNLNQ